MEGKVIDRAEHLRLTPKEALALAAIAVMSVDGSVEDAELKVTNRIIQGDHEAFLTAYAIHDELGTLDSVRLSCEILNSDQILFAVANFLDLVMADGVLSGSEEKLIHFILELSGLPDETLENIRTVLTIKNNFSVFEDSLEIPENPTT